MLNVMSGSGDKVSVVKEESVMPSRWGSGGGEAVVSTTTEAGRERISCLSFSDRRSVLPCLAFLPNA